jgi:hypothetical protein
MLHEPGKSRAMAGSHGLAPLLPRELLGAQDLAHAVGEDFRPGAWHGAESGAFEDLQEGFQGDSFFLGQSPQFHGGQGAHVHAVAVGDQGECFGVIGERKLGVDPALEEDGVAPQVPGFDRLLLDFVQRQRVAAVRFDLVLERTERAVDRTEVRVVDHAECGPGDGIRRNLPLAQGVAHPHHGGPVRAGQQRSGIVEGEPGAGEGFVEKGLDVGHGQKIPGTSKGA